MGIATDLSRVKSNITAALSAIAEKGVTVPDGSNSDALAELIASIQTGSGNVSIFGSITPASNGPITITHNFGDGYDTGNKIKGKTTILIVAAVSADVSNGVYCICSVGKWYDESKDTSSVHSYTRWGNGFFHTSSPSLTSVTGEKFTINNSNASYPFIAGKTYHYAIWDNGSWKG